MVDGFADVDGAGLSDQTIRFRRKEVVGSHRGHSF